MKNFLKQIKQIFVDNKNYFIRCTIMTLIAGLILAIFISLVVPASAADEPTEINPVIIPAGTYTFDDYPSNFVDFPAGYSGFDFPLSFSAIINIPSPDFSSYSTETKTYDHLRLTDDMFIYYKNVDGGVITTDTVYGNVPDQVPFGWASSYLGFGAESFAELIDSYFPNATEQEKANYLQVGSSIFGNSVKTITVLQDAIYDDAPGMAFATWFLANTTNGGDVDPDPEYTISAGWYLWQEELLGEFIPHTLTFNYRSFQRVGASGVPYYSYWSSMLFDNYVENDSYFSRLYYSSISNGRVLVYDDINGGWVDETYRRFYISSPLTLSAEDYFVFNAYTEYYGDTPPSLSGETVPSVPDPDSNIFTNIIGGVLDALDAFTIIGGFSLLDLITTLLGGMALIWILKLLAGG